MTGQEGDEIAARGRPVNVTGDDISLTTLPDLGISRNLSSEAQRLARHPEAVREYHSTPARVGSTGSGSGSGSGSGEVSGVANATSGSAATVALATALRVRCVATA